MDWLPVVLLFILAFMSLCMLAARTVAFSELAEKYGLLRGEYKRALYLIGVLTGKEDEDENPNT